MIFLKKLIKSNYEMGCLCAKNKADGYNIESPSKDPEKGYSWEKKEGVNPKDYTIENAKDSTIVKLPGSVNGQQFIIQNCENCNIYVFDHINTASVDDCSNCNIFLGPTKGSVFMRDCNGCRFLIASQQFRARDCKLVDIFLCCPTQPIIESCSDMRFSCFCYYYDELEEQFQKASLSVFNNNWSNIHDFTPSEDERNWSLLPKGVSIEEFFPMPFEGMVNSVQISTDPIRSIVPQTCGLHQKISHQSCLVVFFCDGHSQKRCMAFIREMDQTNNIIVRTKQMYLDALDAQRIFEVDSYNSVVKRGPVIALEYNGDNCIACCEGTAKAVTTETGCTGLIYVSNNVKVVARQLDNIFNYGDVQMSG